MRNVLVSITTLVFTCLLAMQMSGLHLHVDAYGHGAGLHGTHLHHAGPDDHDHDHSTEVDVPLLEKLNVFSAKLIPLLVTFVIALLAVVWVRPVWSLPVLPNKIHHRVRLRPPLRAPPLS